jgi:hypothetical protein
MVDSSVMDVIVNLPDPVANPSGETPQAIGRHVIENAHRALSHRATLPAPARPGLGLDYWQTEAFHKERGVPLNYSAADLEADEATLEKILPRS